ncbi:hypothetical protein UFOVP1339_33 [uncultured Caudovirales phage]|uniref:Uncharacterized protein n=1 Tax=uncultured Caudovirales phage TaxID=2100421 RepID=A0A6J5S418_9CAUD|nr:hypothetical protein UFOVP1339_33 [uncultured Caudovirales phage]
MSRMVKVKKNHVIVALKHQLAVANNRAEVAERDMRLARQQNAWADETNVVLPPPTKRLRTFLWWSF